MQETIDWLESEAKMNKEELTKDIIMMQSFSKSKGVQLESMLRRNEED